MAKKIKAIKCPQCKSVKKVKLAEDLFLCSSCGTEYFLDNDDVHVHINHKNVPQTDSFLDKYKYPLLVGIAAFLFLMLTLPSFFSPSQQVNIHVPTNTSKQKDAKPKYEDDLSYILSAPQAEVENPILLLLINQRHTEQPRKEKYAVRFYDVLEERMFPMIPLPHTKRKYPEIKTFASGKNYLLFKDDENIYEVDFAGQELKNVSEQLSGDIPEFSSGIASVVFSREDFGFHIFTNNGKEYFYFPEINQLYKTGREVNNAVERNRALAKTQV